MQHIPADRDSTPSYILWYLFQKDNNNIYILTLLHTSDIDSLYVCG